MKKIVLKSLQIQSQMKILHWQTTSYAEHNAFGNFYDVMDGKIDFLIETIQGKYGRVMLGGLDSITVSDYGNLKLNIFIMDMETFFTTEIFACGLDMSKDSELENILHEIKAEIQKLKYLLTLK